MNYTHAKNQKPPHSGLELKAICDKIKGFNLNATLGFQ